MPKVKVNDIELNYETYGEGEPLVMLHGFSASHEMWKPFIPVCARAGYPLSAEFIMFLTFCWVLYLPGLKE